MSFVIPGKFVIPETVTSQFLLREGDRVADFGAGSGFFLRSLATAVGPMGKIYACEIQKVLVEKLTDQARLAGLSNVIPLWCDLEEVGGIKIPDNTLDAGILVNTLFQLQFKEITLKEIKRTLKPGGSLHLVDWSESYGGIGPKEKDVINKEEAITLCESVGFGYERDFVAGEHHYGFSVRKI